MSDYRLQAIKEFVHALLQDQRCLAQEGNVLYCKKLFIVNSVMKWLYNEISEKTMDMSEMKTYLHYINQFLDDEVSLSWDNGSLMVETEK